MPNPFGLALSRRRFVRAARAPRRNRLRHGILRRASERRRHRDPRLVVIILRGALDGLSSHAADRRSELRQACTAISPSPPPAIGPRCRSDGYFFAHPALGAFKRLYDKRQAAVVHAVATGYRDRSHFDGQDVLESGYPSPGRTESGWLNRALSALPASRAGASRGLGVGAIAPLVIRGPAPALGWAPPGGVAPASGDLAQRVLDLYTHADPALGQKLGEALMAEKVAAEAPGTAAAKTPHPGGPVEAMRVAAAGAARLIAAPDGPRIAALAYDGFDTHFNEGAAQGYLAQRLQGLDAAFDALETNLGDAWKDAVVAAITEFGRTARVNGTHGTDHGTATVALLAGGALAGGRIIADWPSLKPASLYEGRDLYPTMDLRGVLKGLLADQFGLSQKTLAGAIFPDSGAIAPMKGLVA